MCDYAMYCMHQFMKLNHFFKNVLCLFAIRAIWCSISILSFAMQIYVICELKFNAI